MLNKKQISKLGIYSAMAAFMAGCGGSSSDGGSDALTISGILDQSSSMMSLVRRLSANASNYVPLAITDYSVRCVTLSGDLSSGEGACNSEGEFSLDLENAEGVPVGCFVLKDDATIVAVMAFEASETGMSGAAQQEGSYIPGSGTKGLNFGTISFDPEAGTAIVPKSQIVAEGSSGEGAASGTWADMSGDWVIQSVANAPEGYEKPCPSSDNDCDGPTEGMTVHLAQYSATDGDGGSHTGLAIWESSSAKTTCFGSGGGEGAELPAGWTGGGAVALAMNGVTTTFPGPAAVSLAEQGGAFCDQTSLTTCDDITGGGWGMTEDQCKFYCVAGNSWQYFDEDASCGGRVHIDWNKLWDATSGIDSLTPSWNGTVWSGIDADTSDSRRVTYVNDAIVIAKDPRARFMFNEIILKGNTGTLVKNETEEYKVCAVGENENCTEHTDCKFARNEKLTIVQTSSTAATFELVSRNKGADSNHANCSENADDEETKWYFKAVKQ